MLCAAWDLYKHAPTVLEMEASPKPCAYSKVISTAYLVTLIVSSSYWIFSSHAACGTPSSAPSSTCVGSPLPWKADLCLSMYCFSCLHTALPSLIETLSKLPQLLLPRSSPMCLAGRGVGFLANVLVHAFSEHMLVLLDPRDHRKGVPSQQAQDCRQRQPRRPTMLKASQDSVLIETGIQAHQSEGLS